MPLIFSFSGYGENFVKNKYDKIEPIFVSADSL
jgi:hypothetical protein